MNLLRTPEECFAELPGFDFPPSYVEIADGDGGVLRTAYVTAGPAEGPVVLLLHGEPTWSFLYRRLIPVFARNGFRVVAPDLVGFGRSDKPAEVGDHSYARHVAWMTSLVVDALDLRDINLLGHDWGGAIGLGLLPEHRERFSRVVLSNSGIPYGHVEMPAAWWEFRRTIENTPGLRVSALIADLAQSPLPPAVLAAYDAPFPDDSYKAGPRAMPGLVPVSPDHPTAPASLQIWETLSTLAIPFLCAFSDGEVFTQPMAAAMQEHIPGARGRRHPVVAGAGHLVQEEAGTSLAQVAVDFFNES
ncbi:haloalkane dehalogenase [Streptomyces sp. NPDC089424]|uniref:haloalkane dehalogenase n=1 Tax=Streptomyces sp. NPDC089424 TaxID=3365917 RepID=UPI003825CA9A